MITETSPPRQELPRGPPYDWTNPAPIMVLVIEHPPAVPLLLLVQSPRPPDVVVLKVHAPGLQERRPLSPAPHRAW